MLNTMCYKIPLLFCLCFLLYGRSYAQCVDVPMAQRIAEAFLGVQKSNNTSNLTILPLGKRTHPTMYACSLPDRWVLIAGDKRVQPILAYSNENTCAFPAEDNMPPAMLYLLNWYGAQIDSLRLQEGDLIVNSQWRDFLEGGNMPIMHRSVIVGPLLSRNGNENAWNQEENNAPPGEWHIPAKSYNKFCPAVTNGTQTCSHALVGCVAVATSQIMWYWQWPHAAVVKDDSGNPVLRRYDWDLMPALLTNESSIAQADMTANLLHDVGVVENMNYGCDSSAASSDSIVGVLRRHFYYSTDDLKYRNSYFINNSIWINMIKSELDALRPVAYAGYNDGSGHQFVIDGYDSNNKFHINFGWGGVHNGYYSLDTIYHNYNFQQTMVMNIRPCYPLCSPSTNPIFFTLLDYMPNYFIIQNGGGLMLGNKTITSGKHIQILSGEYVRLTSGFKVEAGANVYIDVQDMHCDDDLTDDITPSIDPEQIPVKKNDKLGKIEESQPQKFLRNGQILILRDGKTFTITGQRVE